MSGLQLGAIFGLCLGAIGFFAMRALARRVELPETKQALNMAAAFSRSGASSAVLSIA